MTDAQVFFFPCRIRGIFKGRVLLSQNLPLPLTSMWKVFRGQLSPPGEQTAEPKTTGLGWEGGPHVHEVTGVWTDAV